jgi:hypothetical protein
MFSGEIQCKCTIEWTIGDGSKGEENRLVPMSKDSVSKELFTTNIDDDDCEAEYACYLALSDYCSNRIEWVYKCLLKMFDNAFDYEGPPSENDEHYKILKTICDYLDKS